MTTLHTNRLILRRARPDDLADVHACLSDPRAMTYWSTLPHQTLDQTRAWLDDMIAAPADLSDDFLIQMDGRVIGKAGFWRLPEIGYLLRPDAWGKGIATESLTAILTHVFATRDIDAATADVDPRNTASIRVLEKLGFRKTGAAERTWFIGGVWMDSIYFALSRANWPLPAEP
jgi:RimJ/RimL family protein N-acetyltransferase